MKRVIRIMLFLIMTIKMHAFAQNHPFLKDTVYIVLCNSTLENGRPIISYTAIKDLSLFEELKSLNNQDNYLCSFFKRSIVFVEPNFTLVKNKKFYNFADNSQANLFFAKQTRIINKMSKSYQDFGKKIFSNNKSISFQISKIIGDFWLIDTSEENLNSLNHSFVIPYNCYTRNYIYNLKSIEKICKFKIKDISK